MTFKKLLLCIVSVLIVATTFLSQSQIPACQTLALKTVEDAKRQALAGAPERARQLLDQADAACGRSYAVLMGISQVYEQMNDAVKATIYNRSAQRFVAQKSAGATIPPSPSSSSNGPTTVASKPSADTSVVRDKYALVVGVGKFQAPNIPQLKYSAKDATDFAALLTDPNVGRFHSQNVTVLTDSQATSKNVRSALAAIAAKALNDDIVLIYFSTHGSSPAMDRSKIAAGYLVTYDTEVDSLYATAYGMDELASFIKQKLRAERIVTFLDTCYSGDTTRILSQSNSKALQIEALSEDAIGLISQGKGSAVITSSTSRELSWESDERQNSFFTVYLMESLRARKGLGTLRDLYTDLQRSIPTAVREYTLRKGLGEVGKGAVQNPAIYPINAIPDIVIGAPTK